jgi:cobalt-zinc-cadmium efflux system protein
MTASVNRPPDLIGRVCGHRLPTLHAHTGALRTALWISVVVLVAEAVGGWAANSLALLADAGHMLADVAALGLALLMARLARRPATPEKTYGYLRLEILAALANGAVLFVIVGGIAWESVQRFRSAQAINPTLLLVVATIGLIANAAALRVLHAGHGHSLNVRGAYLHVLGDLLGSVGAVAAGGIILATGWTIADPIVSLLISLLILGGAWRLVKDSVDVLLEAVPRHIALPDVAREIASVPGVASVHDLHVWTLTSGVVAMSGHAVVADPAVNQRVLEAVQARMAGLGIRHVTMQIERDDTCEEPARH